MGRVNRRLRWWAPTSHWRIVGLVEEADEIPDDIPARGVVIAGPSAKDPKWLAFDCPCGAERVMVNASPSRRPYWSYRSRFWTGVTLAPSIDTNHRAMKCHYFIRDGRVAWARDSETGSAA